MKALFLDRDGVINKEVDYCHKIEDFEFLPHVFSVCKAFQDAGYALVVVTNQAGIGRGYYSEDDFGVLTQWMIARFLDHGVCISKVYFCPHHPDGKGKYQQDCSCRKPMPGMLLSAQRELGLDLQTSIFVGDKVSDISAGRAAGVGYVCLVRTGHFIAPSDEILADAVYMDLLEFKNDIFPIAHP